MTYLLGVIFYGLRLLELLLWFYAGFVTVSIVAILMRVGVASKNRLAMWIDKKAPKLMRRTGMALSETIAIRVLFWISLLAVGWLGRDSWEYHHTFVLTNVVVVDKTSDNTVYFQREIEPVGLVFPFTFCPDYVPKLDIGSRVEVIVYSARTFPVQCETIRNGPLGIIYR